MAITLIFSKVMGEQSESVTEKETENFLHWTSGDCR